MCSVAYLHTQGRINMNDFQTDLRKTARFLPKFMVTRRIQRITSWLTRFRGVPKPPVVRGLTIRDVTITGLDGTSSLRIRSIPNRQTLEFNPIISSGSWLLSTIETSHHLETEHLVRSFGAGRFTSFGMRPIRYIATLKRGQHTLRFSPILQQGCLEESSLAGR
jgi:hypothetical protein